MIQIIKKDFYCQVENETILGADMKICRIYLLVLPLHSLYT